MNKWAETPLYMAVKNNNINMVELLLENSPDINVTDITGKTVLSIAIKKNNIDMVEILLRHGVNPNIQDKYGNISLHYAVKNKNIEILKLLLERGADINVKNKLQQTPLRLAVIQHNVSIIRLFLNKTPSMYNVYSSLLWAIGYATSNKSEIINLLLSYFLLGKNNKITTHIEDDVLEQIFHGLLNNASLETIASYIINNMISKDYKFKLDYNNFDYGIISSYFLHIFLKGGFKKYYDGYSLIEHDINIDNFPRLDILFVDGFPVDWYLGYGEEIILPTKSQIYQLILWFMIRWGYNPLFYYHWVPSGNTEVDLANKIMYMDFIHNCTIGERLDFLHKLDDNSRETFSNIFSDRYTYYTDKQIKDISLRNVDSPIPLYVYGNKACFKSKRTYTDMSHLLTGERKYINLITDKPDTDYWYKLTEDQKIKLGTELNYAIPVIRYAEGMSRGLFYSSETHNDRYCGTFYYHEPDSDVYLLCNDIMITRNKYSTAIELRNIIDKNESIDYEFKSELIEKLQTFEEENINIIHLLETDMITNDVYNNIAYAIEDVFDQVICEGLKMIGVEVLILTHMAGYTRLVSEVLDTRQREYSLGNLVWKEGYKHRFYVDPPL